MIPQKTSSLFLFLVLAVLQSKAQTFKSKAPIDSIPHSGFYQILITPALSSLMAIDGKDIRIIDKKQQQVPYIIKTGHPAFSKTAYQRLQILSNTITDSGQSVLVIANPNQQTIASLALLIQNTAASRIAFISGSNDEKKWFTVAEQVLLVPQTAPADDRFVQLLSFPASSYRFLKLVLLNGRNDPLNILEVGRYTSVDYKAVYPFIPNPGYQYSQVDSSDGNSYVWVSNTAAYPIHRIQLKLKGAPYFKRQLSFQFAKEQQHSYTVSDTNAVFYPPLTKVNNFSIVIQNGDNPPLKVESLVIEQVQQKIITYLQAGESYTLLCNDSLAKGPQYDLAYFKDSLPTAIPIISFGAITTIQEPATKKQAWLWPAIIGSIAIMGFLAFRLTKEVKQQ
jgi:hypothetical protein